MADLHEACQQYKDSAQELACQLKERYGKRRDGGGGVKKAREGLGRVRSCRVKNEFITSLDPAKPLLVFLLLRYFCAVY